MRVSAALELSTANDQRRYARYQVRIGAGMFEAERPTSAITVVDMSTHGCGIETRATLEVGARVWLKLPGLQSWSSRVIWAADDRAGLSFDQPLHEAVVDRYRNQA